MTTPQPSIPELAEPGALLQSEASKALTQQIRVNDPYGTLRNWGDELLIKPFLVTREKKRSISIEGPVESATRGRIQAFFRSLAHRIESRTGLMTQMVLDINEEGFGWALVFAGQLVLVNRTLRDAHRFGFLNLVELVAESDKLTEQAVALAERYPEVGNS